MFLLLYVGGNHQFGQHGSEDERKDESAGQSKPIGYRHGREDLAGNSLHGEQRNECHENDEGGKKDRFRSVACAFDDQVDGVFVLCAA